MHLGYILILSQKSYSTWTSAFKRAFHWQYQEYIEKSLILRPTWSPVNQTPNTSHTKPTTLGTLWAERPARPCNGHTHTWERLLRPLHLGNAPLAPRKAPPATWAAQMNRSPVPRAWQAYSPVRAQFIHKCNKKYSESSSSNKRTTWAIYLQRRSLHHLFAVDNQTLVMLHLAIKGQGRRRVIHTKTRAIKLCLKLKIASWTSLIWESRTKAKAAIKTCLPQSRQFLEIRYFVTIFLNQPVET